jgi:hypothetical protein
MDDELNPVNIAIQRFVDVWTTCERDLPCSPVAGALVYLELHGFKQKQLEALVNSAQLSVLNAQLSARDSGWGCACSRVSMQDNCSRESFVCGTGAWHRLRGARDSLQVSMHRIEQQQEALETSDTFYIVAVLFSRV